MKRKEGEFVNSRMGQSINSAAMKFQDELSLIKEMNSLFLPFALT